MTVRVSLRAETSQKTRLDETAVTTLRLWGLFSVELEGKLGTERQDRACEHSPETLHWW